MRPRGDSGSAVVEFCVLAVLLLVPLVYVVLAVVRVQAAAHAATTAAREAGRAYVTGADDADGYRRALAAARLAMADQGLGLGGGELAVACPARPCLTAGGSVEVALRLRVALPGVPDALAGAPASVPVEAVSVAPVDRYRDTPYPAERPRDGA